MPSIHQTSHLRECSDCGLIQTLRAVPVGGVATCMRCDAMLMRRRARPVMRATVMNITALFVFLIALSFPLISVQIAGRDTLGTLLTGPEALEAQGMWTLGVVVLLTIAVLPGIKLALNLTLLAALRMRHQPYWVPWLFAWMYHIRRWAMIEVFLLGLFVAYTRLTAIATVEIGTGLYALGAFMAIMAWADALQDPETMWQVIGAHAARTSRLARAAARQEVEAEPADEHAYNMWLPPEGVWGGPAHRLGFPRMAAPPKDDGPKGELIGCDCCRLVTRATPGMSCQRCGSRLHHRRPSSVGVTWALVIASIILYLPANLYPVMTVIRLGAGAPNTILSGAQELLDLGMWPLALLVFFASITVPVLKLTGLALMLVCTQRRTGVRLRDRTRLYRIIEFVGRWSMIDVFMISILVGLVQVGAIASVQPGPGAVAFAAVVVLTMCAASTFDPRLMWDVGAPAARAGGMADRAAPGVATALPAGHKSA